MQRSLRMTKELKSLFEDPPPGISCWQQDQTDDITHLEAVITGPDGTPYEGGSFKLDIWVPERYPFEPPKVHFVTPIYHPNVDTAGRICMDLLKNPPQGSWKPTLNISTILNSILLLMSEPNPDDPLMADISEEYKFNRSLYNIHAKEWTAKHATPKLSRVRQSSPCQPESTASASRKGKQEH